MRKNNYMHRLNVFLTQVVQFLLFLNPKFQAVTVQASLCPTWLESTKTCFLALQLNYELPQMPDTYKTV